ncbi:MAG: hypothetical protein AAF667_06270 [Pseudomonadota bacterium]
MSRLVFFCALAAAGYIGYTTFTDPAASYRFRAIATSAPTAGSISAPRRVTGAVSGAASRIAK